MPVELRIAGRATPFIVNEDSIKNDWTQLGLLLKQPPYTSDPSKSDFIRAFDSFKIDVSKARGKQTATEEVLGQVWDVIAAAYTTEAKKPFPIPFTKTTKTEKNVAPVVVSTITVPPEFSKVAGLCQPLLVSLCPELSKISWLRVTENIYRLGQDDPFYKDFFDQILDMCDRIAQMKALTLKLRLYDLFHQKIEPEYKNANSLGGYKGGASEVLDTLSSALKSLGPPTKIGIPKGNKSLDKRLVAKEHLLKDTSGEISEIQAQDIDRTEVYGNLKFYIEVKADSHTAVEKHCGSRGQLMRIKAVVQTREGKESKSYGILQRHPAVSVTNAAGWLELFTSGAVHIYRTEGFYLFVGGEIFTPAQLTVIDAQVYKQATGKTQLPQSFSQRAADLGALNRYFADHKDDFPAPSVWAMKNLRFDAPAGSPLKIRPFTITVSSNSSSDSKQLNYSVQSMSTSRSINGRTGANGAASIQGFDPEDVQIKFPGLSPYATSPKKDESYLLPGGRYMFTCRW